MLQDKKPGVRSEHKVREVLHNPDLPTSELPASAGLRTWPQRTPDGSAAHPDPHCEEPTRRHDRERADKPSRRCARGPDAANRSAKAPTAHVMRPWSLLLRSAIRFGGGSLFFRCDLYHRFSAHVHKAQL